VDASENVVIIKNYWSGSQTYEDCATFIVSGVGDGSSAGVVVGVVGHSVVVVVVVVGSG
jgi:hypothetical protein